MGLTFRLGQLPTSLFTDASNNVGIGGSPSGSYKLEVTGTGRFTGNLISSTNILIGTTTVGDKLTIVNSGSFAAMQIGNGTNSSFFGYANASGNYNNGASSGDAIIRGFSGVSISGTNGASTNLYINSAGNVGIGTTPSAWGSIFSGGVFQVKNSSLLAYNNNTYLSTNAYFTNASDNYIGNGFATRYIQTSGQHVWETAPNNTSGADAVLTLAERMRITSTGQLATTFNTSDNNAVFANINSNPYGPWIQFTTDPNNTTNYYLVCSALVAGIEYTKLKITSNGNVYNVTGTYTSGVSDIRYKEQIVDANSQWNDIKNLRVVNFKFIKDVEQNGDNALRQIGFIAQEVEKVSPNLIDEMSDEKTGETWKTIKASIIHTKAIKALQEAMTRIEELESRLDKAGL